MSSSGMGRGCPLFVVVHPAVPLPTKASPTLQGPLKDCSGESAVVCGMPEPWTFRLLTVKCQERFLWVHKEAADLAPHPVADLVLQGDTEIFSKLPQALGFENLDPFFFFSFFFFSRVSKQGACFIAVEENGGDKTSRV